MSAPVMLSVSNVSKQYRLGEIGTGTLSHDLKRWWYKVQGKEDPFLRIGEANDRSIKGNSDYVWALQDISFDVHQGEVLGIIGKNGAGKSTLLKILSKVTAPTTGSIRSRGRIASLLEVGTGFHPELTGRENIFLNGAILGMTKKEIASKLDEIIDFSGCERYIDTPVKRYSSGMKVRLAFAVAAFLEPEILIVDEVLAVGDAEFQKKALGKMQDVSQSEGRTVIFVSHNMAAVSHLCSRGLVLQNGRLLADQPIEDAIRTYMDAGNKSAKAEGRATEQLELLRFEMRAEGRVTTSVPAFAPVTFHLKCHYKGFVPAQTFVELFVKDEFGTTVTSLSSWLACRSFAPQGNLLELVCDVPKGFSLSEGHYTIDLNVAESTNSYFEDALPLQVFNSPETGYVRAVTRNRFGQVYTPNFWK